MEPCPPPYSCRLLTDPPAAAPDAVPAGFRAAGEWAVLDHALRFPAVPACTAHGVELTTADGRVVWSIPLLEPQAVPAGAEVLIPAGALALPHPAHPDATARIEES